MPATGPERLLERHRHVRRDAGEQRRLEERAAELVARAAEHAARRRAPARRATWRSTFASASSSISGPTFEAASVPGPTRSAAIAAREALDERVVDRVLHVDPVRADARLARVAELADHRAGDRGVQVGVVEDEERRVAAELERDLLDLSGALRHQQLADLGRAGEAELAHDRVRGQLAADQRRVGRRSGDDREDAARDAGALGELDQRERRERRLLGGLDDHRAARGERGGGLAGDHRGGEVPRA